MSWSITAWGTSRSARVTPVALALDAPRPGELTAAVEAAGSLPVLRPLWRRQRNTRGEVDEVFDGYGLLTAANIVGLADGELSTS